MYDTNVPETARYSALSNLRTTFPNWWRNRFWAPIARWALRRATGKSSLVAHAEEELRRAGFKEDPESFENAMAVIRAFTLEGHSGGSAGFMISIISDLLWYKPIGPLTGDDDEWVYHGADQGFELYQNKRFGEVFREVHSGPTGEIVEDYWSVGRVFKDEDGITFTRQPHSRVPITFPWCPPDSPQIVEAFE